MANGKKTTKKKSKFHFDDDDYTKKRANKYTVFDKGWWYNTDVTEKNPEGKPSFMEGISAEMHRKRPLKSYFGFKKGGKIKKSNRHSSGLNQYD